MLGTSEARHPCPPGASCSTRDVICTKTHIVTYEAICPIIVNIAHNNNNTTTRIDENIDLSHIEGETCIDLASITKNPNFQGLGFKNPKPTLIKGSIQAIGKKE